MKREKNELIFSPSDLIAYLGNPEVTWLNRYALERPGELLEGEPDENSRMIREAGEKHERDYLTQLLADGVDVAMINHHDPNAYERTLQAMNEGRAVIYQARLQHENFAGWADFLVRADGSSHFGAWRYEAVDTKLALSMKPYFAIQLCCYSEMLAALQGALPEKAAIVLGNTQREELLIREYWAYYQEVKRAFLEQQRNFNPADMPQFRGMANYDRWQAHVDGVLHERDDLSLIANIREKQIEKLQIAGIVRAGQLAMYAGASIAGMADPVLAKLQQQARLQRESQPGQPPAYEILQPDPDAGRKGFALLPPSSPSDVCFDIEGYPLVDGGLEYLLGAVYAERGELQFRDWWSHDRQQERASFESFVDWVHDRWKRDPAMHIYHYASYEVTALKKLMCRFASREEQIDDLLRNHVFVDLFTVVRQAIAVGEPSYSLKYIEHLYAPARQGEVATAEGSMVYYNRWLNARDGEDCATSKILKTIRDYNEQDCRSTWQLADWLRARQAEAQLPFVKAPSPKELGEELIGRAALAKQMLADIPADRTGAEERWRVHELLANLLEYHRRESKSLYWKLFERMAMTEEELVADAECIGGAQRTSKEPVPEKRSLIYEYCFPDQESKLRTGDECLLAADGKTQLDLLSIDYDASLFTIKRAAGNPLAKRLSLIPKEVVGAQPIVDSIERTVMEYANSGRLQPLVEDFLFRREPRVKGLHGGALVPKGLDVCEGAKGAVCSLDRSVLFIQGPPGSGKTTTGGEIIAELLRSGKRVGVMSNGHAAIGVLMKAAIEAVERLGVPYTAGKCGGPEDSVPDGVVWIEKNKMLFDGREIPQLVGGSAWLFSCPEAVGLFDYLFIDEAGQVPVANLVGVAPCTRNIVLLGDQMQLSQPTAGIHPGESGDSTLDYYLQSEATVPENRGIFLPTTWRMRPEVCEFISDAIYDGRLRSSKCTEDRSIEFGGPVKIVTKDAGLLYVPVVHSDNAYESDEEVEKVREIIAELEGHWLHLADQARRRLLRDDVLVVAPFNLQVRKLQSALPGVRVGTVDKFQGQQAPVVIYSMTASEGDASPRGISFLFDKHRINVAISRAQILAVVVASPALVRTDCNSLEQMRAVNMYCMAVEAGRTAGAAVLATV